MKNSMILLCFVALFCIACTPAVTPDAGMVDGGIEYGELAIVESIDLLIMESFPVQIRAVIKGDLPDGCAEIVDIEATRNNEKFTVKIITSHPIAAMCTEALVPFVKSISLDVLDLPAGTYTVEAYGKTASFTFSVKNSIQE